VPDLDHAHGVAKTSPFRADTARWRERLHCGAAIYPVEVNGTTLI
jgi:hypothetical protein